MNVSLILLTPPSNSVASFIAKYLIFSRSGSFSWSSSSIPVSIYLDKTNSKNSFWLLSNAVNIFNCDLATLSSLEIG